MDKMVEPSGWRPAYNAPIRNWYQSKLKENIAGIMCHELEAIPIIQEVIRVFDPELMIELGTGAGGFTLAMHEAKPNCLLYSFDLFSVFRPQRKIVKFFHGHEQTLEEFVRLGFGGDYVTFACVDLLKGQSQWVLDLLADSKRKLLYCDNGDKVKEVNMYAPALKKGDMLGVHDWASGNSIDYSHEGVATTLEPFIDHEVNRQFIDERLRTRFFIRT